MRFNNNVSLALLTGAVFLAMQPVVAAETVNQSGVKDGTEPAERLSATSIALEEHDQAQEHGEPSTLDEVHSAPTTVEQWEYSIAQAKPIEITDVQIDDTGQGLTLQLETSGGELAISEPSVTGNALTVDIFNAVLRSPDGDDFSISNPTDGIALVNITRVSDSQVRIAITGSKAPPAVEISTTDNALTANIIAGDPTARAEEEAIQIGVTGEQEGYFVPESRAATRTDTPLRDIPNSIQVIPRQIIEDQQPIELGEVLRNAAGVTNVPNNASRGLSVTIRGFDGAPILRNGFLLLDSFASDTAEPEIANLEQVEVLRGPASVLYGQVEPGGIVNLVTKRPLSEPYYNLQLQGGSQGFISPIIDVSGPLTEDGRVLYRLNALYRHEENFRDFDNNFERFFIAPTVTWQISDRTDLTLELEYVNDEEPYDTGAIARNGSIADVPRERVFSDPDSVVNQEFFRAGYTLDHRFSDKWKLRNQFLFTCSSYGYSITPYPIGFVDEAAGILNRPFIQQEGTTDTFSLYTNIQGEFNTGSIKHTLLFGIDLARSENTTVSRGDFRNPDAFSPINIFDDTVDIPSPESLPLFADRNGNRNQLGIYVQDQIDILDNLILVAGLRYDSSFYELLDAVPDTRNSQIEDALTPRIGIVYQPVEPLSIYANYSRSFIPNTGTDANGGFLKPEEGEGFEVGIRGEIIMVRLVATLAFFDITKQNVATQDPNEPFASVSTGEQRSRGVDFNLTGEVLPGWNVVASYAYIDAEVTEDNTDIIGNRLIGVPEHSASLWTTYEIQSGNLQGLGFGLGFNLMGERQGDLANSFKTDSYFLTNAAIFYQRINWQIRLNVDNLFDVEYIESLGGAIAFGNDWGRPLTVRASVSHTF